MRKGISGYVMVRNGLILDYCFIEAIKSLLPVCDEVVVCDSDSNDGTSDALLKMASEQPKIRLLNKPWTDPVGRPTWWVEWINWTRGQLAYDHQLQLDADEVLGPESYSRIQQALDRSECLWFQRLNFWGSAQTIALSGQSDLGIGDGVARFGPTSLYMPSDEPLTPEPEIRVRAGRQFDPVLCIYHYGFLRRREALIAKTRACLRAWFDITDERVEKADREGLEVTDCVQFERPLMPFVGNHPAVAHKWLLERGYRLCQ